METFPSNILTNTAIACGLVSFCVGRNLLSVVPLNIPRLHVLTTKPESVGSILLLSPKEQLLFLVS
ncbi:MAG: hypothetical protein WCI00_03605 [bacterium]